MNYGVVEIKSTSLVDKTTLQEFEDKTLKLPQVDPNTEHFYAEGLYLRRIFIPKGCVATGAIHLTETIDIMVSGDLTIVTTEGKKRVSGHNIIVSKPGLKKVAFAHEDTIFITAHAVTSVKDKTLETIEKELFVDNYHNYTPSLEVK